MNMTKGLAVIAAILFGVDFVLVVVGGGGPRAEVGLLYLGLACFAGAHCL